MKPKHALATLTLLASILPLGPATTAAETKGAVAHTPATMPKGLTHQGKLLWELEGVLKATSFGREDICTWFQDPRTPWNFNDVCAPLSDFQLYRYSFAHPGRSALHLSFTYHRYMEFGNYPAPVLIRGRLIACDPHDRKFLIDYQSARSLTLDCLTGAFVNYRWPQVRREAAGRGAIDAAAPTIKVAASWALDWDYACPSSAPSGPGGSLRIQILNRRTGNHWTAGGTGKNFSGEQIFPPIWVGQWHVHIRATSPSGVRQGCRWDVWVVR